MHFLGDYDVSPTNKNPENVNVIRIGIGTTEWINISTERVTGCRISRTEDLLR